MNDQATMLRGEADVRIDPIEFEHSSSPSGRPISFGRFRAVPAARALTCGDRAIEIGSRAFDLLVVLLQFRGEIVAKEDIVRRVWPNTIVEESNLRFQVAALRRALGDDRELIKTVPSRGYMLVAEPDERVVRYLPVMPVSPGRVESHGAHARSAIFIVEEDDDMRDALCRLLRPFDAMIQSFGSLEALLAQNAGTPGRHADQRLAPHASGTQA